MHVNVSHAFVAPDTAFNPVYEQFSRVNLFRITTVGLYLPNINVFCVLKVQGT